jgi:AcrR family transcriptional regulator
MNSMPRAGTPSFLRREQERSAVREKIMDAARILFASDGYEAVTLRRVADAISYTAPAIYRHFQDKEQLIREICAADFARFNGEFQSAAQLSDPIERLKAIGRIYIKFGVTNPHHYRLMFMVDNSVPPDDENLQIKDDPSQDAYALLRLTVAEIVKAGLFKPAYSDVEALAQTFWGSVHGVVALEICKKQHESWLTWVPLENRAELMISGLVKGFLA